MLNTDPNEQLAVISSKLPPDLPDVFIGPDAWTTRDLVHDKQKWLYCLTDEDKAELEKAALHFISSGKNIGEISSVDFPLPFFSNHLQSLKSHLLHGTGVQVIRGFDLTGKSQDYCAAVFCGIGSHLGSARSQNADGHILGHVRDTGASSADPTTRIYKTAERQTFHTDSADVVGLLCINAAKEGGTSLLVSVSSMVNRLRQEAPHLLAELFRPIATDRRGEVPIGQLPYLEIPVLSWYQQALTVFYQRQYIESAQRHQGAPRLSSLQIDALDCFDALANDPDLYFNMDLEPGDMQFVYNHSQLHDRTAFTDWNEPERKRHLFRLWLSLTGDRELPPVFKQRYGSVEVGNRGGIITDKTRQHAPIYL